jgi:hypothetical protein
VDECKPLVVGFAGGMHAARTRGGAVELASAELRFETTSDGAPAEVLTKVGRCKLTL